METIKCELCDKIFKDKKALAIHLTKIHKYSIELYYKQYVSKNSNEGFCIVCGKQTKFLGLSLGYRLHCSKKCSSLDKIVQDKKDKTTLEKYGVKHCKHTEAEKQKCKDCHKDLEKEKTRIKKFKQAVSLHSKEDIQNIIQKRKTTSLNKYGTEFPQQSYQIKNKTKQTCLERFGVEYNLQRDEIKQLNSKRMIEFMSNLTNNERLILSKKMLREQGKKNCVTIDNTKLDGSWEVLVYNYCISHKLSIERNIPINYYDNVGKIHTTFIDFKINNILFEIKGNHLLENKLKSINYEFKLDAWRNANVIIITSHPQKYHMNLKMLDINKFKENIDFENLLLEVLNE